MKLNTRNTSNKNFHLRDYKSCRTTFSFPVHIMQYIDYKGI